MSIVKINNIIYAIKSGISIIEACKLVGHTIPRFCYTETLSISGNCRMCLVEIEGLEKPVASCVTLIEDGMSIWIDTPFVKKARENVLETILLNHPLDCPICDQGGECDLQDQAKKFGRNKSRLRYSKNTLADKECGPIIKTIMTRCITCTRCVRFASEIAGVPFFGTLNRGVSTEIGGYSSNFFNSELSGNVVDLCPVGALTSKPYTFKVRPWELRLVESIDTSDSLGSSVYVNYQNNEVYRVLPKPVATLNGSLLTDKGRYSYDANSKNRLTKLLTFDKSCESFKTISSNAIFDLIDSSINKNINFNFIINDMCDLESARFLNHIKNKYLNISMNIFNIDSLDSSQSLNVTTNTQQNIISRINNNNFENFILIGSNPRFESALLNARIRFKYMSSTMNITSLGLPFSSNFPVSFINISITNVFSFLEGKLLSSNFKSSTKNCIIFGISFFSRLNTRLSFLTEKITKILPNTLIINLEQFINSAGLISLNLKKNLATNNLLKNDSIYFFLNLDDSTRLRLFKQIFSVNNKSIWLNTHGSILSLNSDFIIPIASDLESKALYCNFENRIQTTNKVISSVSNVQKLSTILSTLFNLELQNSSAFKYQEELLLKADAFDALKNTFIKVFNSSFNMTTISSLYPIKGIIKDFYLTNNTCHNSSVLRDCSSQAQLALKQIFPLSEKN